MSSLSPLPDTRIATTSHSLNNMLTRIARPGTCLMLALLLAGCQKQAGVDKANTLLFPELQYATPVGFTLIQGDESISITQTDSRWRIEEPVGYPANALTVDWFLQSLKDSEIGKPVELDTASRSSLLLNEDNGLVASFHFDDDSSATYVFGELEMKRNPEESLVAGVGVTAHRYVRRIDENSDTSFLLPMSMVGLSAQPDTWADPAMIRVPSSRQLTISKGDTIIWQGKRDQPFGKLMSQNPQTGEMFTDEYACFEDFLKAGFLDGIGQRGATDAADGSLFEVTITDFQDASYRFEFGSPELPSQQEIERAATQASFSNAGIAETLVPFSLTQLQKGTGSNVAEQQLVEKNQVLAEQLDGVTAFFKYEQFACLQDYVFR